VSILDGNLVRVALFADCDPGVPAGLATTIAGLLDHVPGDIHVVPYLNRPGLSSLLHADEIIRSVRQDEIDLIHLASAGPTALAALFAATRVGLPVIGSFDVDLLTASPLRRRYLRTLCDLADQVLASSSCARDTLRGLTDEDKITLWRPGVDVETFAPEKRSASLREEWQVSRSRPAVIYAGTLSEEHCVRRLLALELELRRTRPMHRLIVAGDGPALAELRFRCSNALFLGRVPECRMAEMLASADLFISPSERCSAHHAVLEAQASGLPVVVMARGAASERVARAGSVVCAADADFIVDTASLIRTEDRRRDMGRAAREFALTERWEHGLAPLFADYRTLAAARSARPKLAPSHPLHT
jgi:glycosyltransferase involved in cell wall biosynthesis